MRFARRAACVLLLCTLAGASALSRASAQDKQPPPVKPELTLTDDYTTWGDGPEGSFARTGITARDGSSLTISDYVYKSEKRIKELQKNCTQGALKVVEDSSLPGAKKKGIHRRTLAIFRDSEGHESAVLCRSKNKRMLTTIHGKTVEHVLGFERTAFPK